MAKIEKIPVKNILGSSVKIFLKLWKSDTRWSQKFFQILNNWLHIFNWPCKLQRNHWQTLWTFTEEKTRQLTNVNIIGSKNYLETSWHLLIARVKKNKERIRYKTITSLRNTKKLALQKRGRMLARSQTFLLARFVFCLNFFTSISRGISAETERQDILTQLSKSVKTDSRPFFPRKKTFIKQFPSS